MVNYFHDKERTILKNAQYQYLGILRSFFLFFNSLLFKALNIFYLENELKKHKLCLL